MALFGHKADLFLDFPGVLRHGEAPEAHVAACGLNERQRRVQGGGFARAVPADTKYKYVIGARIKSEKKSIREKILSWEKKSGDFYECKREDDERLIVGYSEARAKKDAYNRSRGVERLRKAYGSGKLTKDQVNRRGYNKFLEISKDVQVVISDEKIVEDEKWDGLKGYATNTKLAADEVVAQYHGLWVVERTFSVSSSKSFILLKHLPLT